ncbi:dinitrogenase iron-molybdenum cofactor biosynthesis protein [Sedimenticola thiotaurini]|uniref:Dinitrogenase iron-molybdenum cofactor biosynthesis protein n=1 Tax=Sedimenticola thiotaurini TaxID=1543721 RepID=A0A0F7K3B1_9GAMM|nr:dinitrogenase iron-molybdenum cofactor biosynthesis protein [Sedimenticola thiotaurini]AKH21705.1 dinitrogenase iron-molybdenum cofactor biosynthesis protein [Sedimenticola thiotaurini]
MNSPALDKEIALRIGLAARELPETDIPRLLRVLDDAVGLPPDKKQLAGLTVKQLKSAADGELADLDSGSIRAALACLKGDIPVFEEPLPEVVPYQDGEMPNSIRVACASNRGDLLDGHFGSCRRFLIYQVGAAEQRLIDIREIGSVPKGEDKNLYRVAQIADCQILFVASIGGTPAAKVIRAGIHPVKKPQAGSAAIEIAELGAVIGRSAPPWLAKIMGQPPEQRVRFVPSTLESTA